MNKIIRSFKELVSLVKKEALEKGLLTGKHYAITKDGDIVENDRLSGIWAVIYFYDSERVSINFKNDESQFSSIVSYCESMESITFNYNYKLADYKDILANSLEYLDKFKK